MSMFWASCQNHNLGTIEDIPGIAGFWTFDNISGSTVVDESGLGNDGTNTLATFTAGYIGNAATFSASTIDYIDYGLGPWNFIRNTLDFGLSFWVKRNTSGAYFIAGSTLTSTEKGFFIQINASGEVRFTIYRASNQNPLVNFTTTGANFPTGTFSNLVITGNGPSGVLSVYIDGLLVGSTALPSSGNSGADNRSTQIGRSNFSSDTGSLDGQIDQVRFYSNGLTDGQVALLAAEV